MPHIYLTDDNNNYITTDDGAYIVLGFYDQKNPTNWKMPDGFTTVTPDNAGFDLLLETGGKLLLETDGRLLLEDTTTTPKRPTRWVEL